ncbi:MAG: glycoside hydrolase family 28 protein [Candidatus Cyclobacteriaceae bacterium M3_2C_046]
MIRFLISLFIISNSFLIANLKAESWSSQQSLNIDGIFNPYEYGAKGDGKSIDTKAIQATIDQCHQEGGGIVYLQNGIFISGTIILKSNVHLYVESGAVLKGSNDLDHFPSLQSNYPSYEGEMVTNKMLIYAEDAENITIKGRGTIDGNGDAWIDGPYGTPSFSLRPRIIHFRGCENIVVRDVTLYNSGSWVQSYQSCKNLLVDGITVDSRPNKNIEKPRFADAPSRNNDGLDLVDCEQVRIANCYINSGDDAICLKSFSPDQTCRDITITNCVVSANASGIKIGTETSGMFEDITVSNCVINDIRRDAISIATVDGAGIERVNISNISMRNIKGSAIFIRLGQRNRTYRKKANINTPYLRDILIENVQGTRVSAENGGIIAGIKSIPVENVRLNNISLQFEGGGKAEEAFLQIPEKEKEYPNGLIFGRLTAYGFYIRYAENISMQNINLRFTQNEQRPAIIAVEVDHLSLEYLQAEASASTPEMIRLINCKKVLLSKNRPATSVPVYLTVYGKDSDEIILLHNFLQSADQKYVVKEEATTDIVNEIGTIE